MLNYKIAKRSLGLGLLTVLFPVFGHSIGLNEAMVVRENVAFSAQIDARSFDGMGFDILSEFDGFTSGDLFQISPFLPAGGRSTIETTLLSEVCGFCGQNPNYTDSFGYLDQSGDFVSILDGGPAQAGDSASVEFEGDDEIVLAVRTPQTVLSAIDADNEDQSAHILGAKVETAGTVNLENADLFGASLAFDLQVGDILVFVEDLLATGNTIPFVPRAGDFDFNDMVFVMREIALESDPVETLADDFTEVVDPSVVREDFDSVEASMDASAEVPEPSTCVLLLLGLFGVAARARGQRS